MFILVIGMVYPTNDLGKSNRTREYPWGGSARGEGCRRRHARVDHVVQSLLLCSISSQAGARYHQLTLMLLKLLKMLKVVLLSVELR